ncbi:MAG: serine hydrolase domain-containing protein [Alphaproteobacteria bacterium]|nr:serine hydrolase domain-containing protein [Alphaproteobacteria bacterium]
MRRVRSYLAAVLIGILAVSGAARADTGMLDWEDREIAQALDAFMPRLMDEENVPGAQVAFIRDGRMVYERAFGVRNVIGRAPVTTETIFEAASISKPVAAHVALQLVAAGKLRLDKDIGLGLEPPWLDPGADGSIPKITLEQVLTHTSGLSNDIRRTSHSLVTPPGGAFSYAGEGFGYLGYAITAHEQRPFADVARVRLLEPLGMAATGFALEDAQMALVATGHTGLWMPLAMVFVPFVAVFVIGALLAFLVVRLVLQQPHMESRHLVLPGILAGIATIVVLLELVGLGLLTAVLLIAFIFVLCVALAAVLWRLVFHLLGFTRARPGTVMRREEVSGSFWTRIAVVLAVVSLLPLMFMSVPLPLRAAGDVHPAASLRGSAGEIALFAQEIIDPRLLERADMHEMTRPHVPVGHGAPEGLAWGLGIGVRDRRLSDGDTQRTLWQWGSNPGYSSLLVIEPRSQAALVVLTNSQSGGRLVQELGAHVFGGLVELERDESWIVPFAAVAPNF